MRKTKKCNTNNYIIFKVGKSSVLVCWWKKKRVGTETRHNVTRTYNTLTKIYNLPSQIPLLNHQLMKARPILWDGAPYNTRQKNNNFLCIYLTLSCTLTKLKFPPRSFAHVSSFLHLQIWIFCYTSVCVQGHIIFSGLTQHCAKVPVLRTTHCHVYI